MNTVGAVAKVVPHTPTQAPTRGLLTSDTQLEVEWEFVTDMIKAGGSDITSYSLYIDDGNGGEFYEVDGDTKGLYTLNSIIVQSGIASGATYRVKYKVSNIYGFSQFSPISTITAMTVPGAPTGVVVFYDTDKVKIDWAQPAFTGGF